LMILTGKLISVKKQAEIDGEGAAKIILSE
jgi:hypothetical protein